jgi:hypothetical protein
MDESESSDTIGPSRADYVAHVLGTARETLARSRGDNQFRDADEPLGVPEWRSRGRRAPLAPRDRTQPAPAPAPSDAPTWENERGAVLEAIKIWTDERDAVLDALRSLSELCETLHERIAELQKRPMAAAYHEMKQWGDAECARIEKESLQQQREKEEPLDLPSLRTLRQNTDA